MRHIGSLFFIFFALTPTCIFSFPSASAIMKTAFHWAVSAGPSWIESYHYSRLLSDQKALELYGSDEQSSQDERFIRDTLQELGYKQWQTVTIKLVKKSMQEFVLTAATSNDKILFINSLYYDRLSNAEKRAILAHAVTGIDQQHVRWNALMLAFIPIVTHIGIESFFAVAESCGKVTEKDRTPGKLFTALDYGAHSCPFKLVLNSLLTAGYFKYKAQKQDRATADKVGKEALLSYYTKLDAQDKQHDQLVSWCQPTTADRASYLTNSRL